MFGLYSFFYRQFEGEFNRTMKTPSMLRYVISFPMVSGEFLNATSPFCPEEVSMHVYIYVCTCTLHHTMCTRVHVYTEVELRV